MVDFRSDGTRQVGYHPERHSLPAFEVLENLAAPF
jgi:hypothetical protein